MSWFSLADLGYLLPVIALTCAAFAALLVDAMMARGAGKPALPYISLGGALVAAVAILAGWSKTTIALNGSLAVGPFAAFLALVIVGALAIAILYSADYTRPMGFEVGEYYALLLFGAAGMVLLVAANELVTLFIAFEIMSLAVYTLVAIGRNDARAIEGAIKYFVLGAFSSGFLLYGLSLLYGATGTIYLDQMAAAHGTAGGTPGIALVGIALLIVGFGFKVGAAPFHAWIPDAYQGAPAAVTGFMAVAVKTAAFGVFFRVLDATGVLATVTWTPGAALTSLPGTRALWLLAALTMIVGNVAALTQSNVKRLLAYSGIAHSGYLLVGLAAATRVPDAKAAALYYLAAYGATTIGAFAVLTALRRAGRDVEDVDDLGGLARERPGVALAMAIFMASLLGIPPTAGFFGKLWVFRAAIAADMKGLVVLALVTTAVSIYYYLRVIAIMYTAEPSGEKPAAMSPASAFAVGSMALLTIYFGVSSGVFEAAKSAVTTIAGG